MPHLAATLVTAAALLLAFAPAAAPSEPAWQTHALARGGSITLPASWRNFTRPTRQLHSAVSREARRNPSVAPLLYALTARASPLVRLVAADLAAPSLRRGFVTNASVLAQRTNGTLERWAATNVAALRRMRTVVKPIRRADVELPAGRAVQLRYVQRVQTGTPVRRVAVTQYALTRNRTVYLLTFTTSLGQLAAYRPVFDQSARSLRLR